MTPKQYSASDTTYFLFTLVFCSCLFSVTDFSKMAGSVGSSGYSAITRVLFCGPYWPASTMYTKEYLQNYPFIQVSDACGST